MFTNIYKEFKLRKENNNTILDILNMFWLEGSFEKEFEDESFDFQSTIYFKHPEDAYYF